jgi:hypothetical protein
MRSERKIRSGVADKFIEVGDKLRAAHRRLQSSDQQTVVAARVAPRNCSGSVSADAVGDEPLTRFRGGEVSADFTAKLNFRLFRHGPPSNSNRRD